MTSSSIPHPFEKTKGYYYQNPSKAHMAAGFAAATTGATSMAAWIGGRSMPKVAKVIVFGSTFISHLVALNMLNTSLVELTRVIVIGKNIMNDGFGDMKNMMSALYDVIFKTEQSNPSEFTTEQFNPSDAIFKTNQSNPSEFTTEQSNTSTSENPATTDVILVDAPEQESNLPEIKTLGDAVVAEE